MTARHLRNYSTLALSWAPDSQPQETRVFYAIIAIVMAIMLVIAVVVTSIDVPPKERVARQAVPERVAQFINQQQKPEPPKPTVAPTPVPTPIPTPKPKVVRRTETEAEKKKPLTEVEKQARDKAQKSGLLALSAEIADLIDTTDVSANVGAKVKKSSKSAQQVAALDTSALTKTAGQGSGGVNTSDYVGGVSSTQLSQREIALVNASLLKGDTVEGSASASAAERGKERSGNVRSEEEVTMVFDQNKGPLYSIYNRERRKKPGLKGKIVLEITIAPNGSVTAVKITSSELNDPKLEKRLVARIKNFKFTAKEVETVTVTFPIEFLPS
ncbi:AgmX/PglI C-terminal domain-containing protein [Agarilytica rhodophyticola]|uniref:AgmX/PglI C-terminal domain-containing protein n=1 Tax=Agarilytica rhodophyticola TaxID=1737490 RepID=UPI000B341816|nr:AgmX/PglI C-terminal domain-containing protein [Agarilytica rhodophyticola]